ncbi:MAG: molybdenum cofactor biosynthesis protein MoaE [Acidimicrobiales bacterium]|nr:molybdenum cofactor biosynthesis protein MoaE [Acidimicrobiales bacterium]
MVRKTPFGSHADEAVVAAGTSGGFGPSDSDSETWLGLFPAPLPIDEVTRWIGRSDCGAVVVFRGDARNHAQGRVDVAALEYEAYESQVVPRLGRLADEARKRWPDLGRIALIHRSGLLAIGDAAVIVAVSSPHRETAFEAGRWCIDTLKETVPIWKRETWAGGEHWGVDAQHVVDVPELGVEAAFSQESDAANTVQQTDSELPQ